MTKRIRLSPEARQELRKFVARRGVRAAALMLKSSDTTLDALVAGAEVRPETAERVIAEMRRVGP